MALFKKKKKEENIIEDVKTAETVIGDIPKLSESSESKETTIGEVVIGMSDVEYRSQVLSLLMEVNQRLIDQKTDFDKLVKVCLEILQKARE